MSDLLYIQNIPVERLREQVVELLQEHYAHSTFEIEEYERRLERVSVAEERAQLLEVVQDLPALRSSGDDGGGGVYSSQYSHGSGAAEPNRANLREEESMLAVFSGVSRKGRWKPARKSKVFALFGGLELDYTQAQFLLQETYIDAFCLFGGAELTVPEGINVEVEAIPLFGGVENKTSGEYVEGAPTLYIKAFILFGGLEIGQKSRKRRR